MVLWAARCGAARFVLRLTGESLIVRAGFFIISPRPDFLLPYGGGVQCCPGLLEVCGVIVMRGHFVGSVAKDTLASFHIRA
jgi:hypothetical protein